MNYDHIKYYVNIRKVELLKKLESRELTITDLIEHCARLEYTQRWLDELIKTIEKPLDKNVI